jgi:Fe-S-cluster containining protein
MRQFIPSDYCLSCKGCCRFKEQDSVWTPCLLDEEIQALLDKKIPPAAISQKKKLIAISASSQQGFVCPFLRLEDNQCQIYSFRPWECQLYPFLINLRSGKVILTVDLNCPYLRGHLNSQEFKQYTEELVQYLNSPAQLKILKANPQLLEAYEDVAEIVELNF